MEAKDFETLVEALNFLKKEGFEEDFSAEKDGIRALVSKALYQPEQLTMTSHYRFEGMTNPSDATELLALQSDDGIRGTLVMSYGAKHSHDEEMIKRLK